MTALPNPPLCSRCVGGLRPVATAVLPNDRRLPHLFLSRQPRQLPERPGGVGPRAAGVRSHRAIPAHWHTGQHVNNTHTHTHTNADTHTRALTHTRA